MCSNNTSVHLTLLKPVYRWTWIWQQHARFWGGRWTSHEPCQLSCWWSLSSYQWWSLWLTLGRASLGCGGLLTRIHIHDHEINQGQRILELNQHILYYPVELHYSGVCQSKLMRSRDQWVLVQAVIDRLGQDVHAGSPITERIMDLEWPQDARNCGECWST
jgi:hypothetical protein